MEVNVSGQIAQLRSFSRKQLLELWQKLYGKAAPPGIRRELIVSFLAYRIQEARFGELKPATVRRLQQTAKARVAHPRTPVSDSPPFKSGTRLVRKWRGKAYVVTIIQDGFEHAGKRYSSLSQVARLITGTRWSGPLFFGLRKSQVREHMDAQRR